jgi:hypothetical protein
MQSVRLDLAATHWEYQQVKPDNMAKARVGGNVQAFFSSKLNSRQSFFCNSSKALNVDSCSTGVRSFHEASIYGRLDGFIVRAEEANRLW